MTFQSVAAGLPEQFGTPLGFKVCVSFNLEVVCASFGSVRGPRFFGRLHPPKPKCISYVKRRSLYNRDVQGLQASNHIFAHSRVAWSETGHEFQLPWALFGASRALLGRCGTFPGGHSDAPGTLFNSIWVLWHAQKVAESMQKAILTYFGTPLGAFLVRLYIKIHAFL